MRGVSNFCVGSVLKKRRDAMFYNNPRDAGVYFDVVLFVRCSNSRASLAGIFFNSFGIFFVCIYIYIFFCFFCIFAFR